MSERIVTPEWIAIERSWCAIGVATPASMLHALDEVEFLRADHAALKSAVERVRALHDTDWCKVCVVPRPCPTLRALEGTP